MSQVPGGSQADNNTAGQFPTLKLTVVGSDFTTTMGGLHDHELEAAAPIGYAKLETIRQWVVHGQQGYAVPGLPSIAPKVNPKGHAFDMHSLDFSTGGQVVVTFKGNGNLPFADNTALHAAVVADTPLSNTTDVIVTP